MNRESLSILLPVLGKLLYTYPDIDFLGRIRAADLFGDIPYESDTDGFNEGQKLLCGWQADENADDAVIADYQDLFVGVRDRVRTPAWESIYVSPEPMMFGECTLDARLWYDRYGMELKNLHHEPDDHMGLELIFFAHLLKADPVAAQEFFTKHIALWYGRFFSAMHTNAATAFYRGLSLLLAAMCKDIEEAIAAKA